MAEDGFTFARRLRAVCEALLASAGMLAFALHSAAGGARELAGAGGLLLVAIAFYLSMRTGERPAGLFGVAAPRRRQWAVVGVGAALGGGLGVAYRAVWKPTPLPAGLEAFVLVAAAVGAAEELLYRGYVQGRLAAALAEPRQRRDRSPHPPRRSPRGEARGDARPPGGSGDSPTAAPARPAATASTSHRKATARWTPLVAAIVLAAAAHTAYKTALFVCPPAGVAIDYAFLITWTLIGGAAFGALRAWAGSVWPAVAAHVAFDLIAYGDATRAPWWVWT